MAAVDNSAAKWGCRPMNRIESNEGWCDRAMSQFLRWRTAAAVAQAFVFCLLIGCASKAGLAVSVADEPGGENLRHAKVFLAAGDFRRAIEACQRDVVEHPSAERYVYLTYVFQALDAYVEFLAMTDQWVKVEHLYLNLVSRGPEDLLDPPDVLARIAKEVIQSAAQKQADVTAAMASRLDDALVKRLWTQQTAWRKSHVESWWFGVPPDWRW